MSIESAQAFWHKAQIDESLQTKLAAIQHVAITDVVKLAAETGFTFTADEYPAAVKLEQTRQQQRARWATLATGERASGSDGPAGHSATARSPST